MKLTRRELAAALAGAPAALSQAPEQKTETAEELYKAELESNRRALETVAKVDLPMSTEPAFSFRAQ